MVSYFYFILVFSFAISCGYIVSSGSKLFPVCQNFWKCNSFSSAPSPCCTSHQLLLSSVDMFQQMSDYSWRTINCVHNPYSRLVLRLAEWTCNIMVTGDLRVLSFLCKQYIKVLQRFFHVTLEVNADYRIWFQK